MKAGFETHWDFIQLKMFVVYERTDGQPKEVKWTKIT